jgi:hypothetical protein
LLLLLASTASAQVPGGIAVEVAGTTKTFSAEQIQALPQDTVTAAAHNGPRQVFVGPQLRAVLIAAGARLDSLRGRALAQYVVVDARDDYRVVLAVAELSPDFTSRKVILARMVDGQPQGPEQGPWRLIMEGELRPARWVRQVRSVRLRAAD